MFTVSVLVSKLESIMRGVKLRVYDEGQGISQELRIVVNKCNILLELRL